MYRRVSRSSSRRDMRVGSQATPPLPPPNGTWATAHFHVIQAARAVTSSRVTAGWNRMPPLAGPRAMLYCTRYPVKTSVSPLSISTGQETTI